MKPLDQAAAHQIAVAQLAHLRAYRASDTYREFVKLLDAMVAEYQARLIDCPDAEVQAIRIAARQIDRLRVALAAEDLQRVSLTI